MEELIHLLSTHSLDEFDIVDPLIIQYHVETGVKCDYISDRYLITDGKLAINKECVSLLFK